MRTRLWCLFEAFNQVLIDEGIDPEEWDDDDDDDDDLWEDEDDDWDDEDEDEDDDDWGDGPDDLDPDDPTHPHTLSKELCGTNC